MLSSFNYQIVELEAVQAEARLVELSDILVDAVEGGSSVSFLMPFTQVEALAYWQNILPAIADGRTVLLAALVDGRTVGTVQLSLNTPPNQPHRADVAKLLVHSTTRRRGIGRALMQGVEGVALRRDRTLLTLDTWTGSVAERLYLSLGYVLIGTIPKYALFSNGQLGDASFFYKQLSLLPVI